ncbi:phage tail protein [Yoonia sp.]|uniref:phage tail protein n=1 Tax=Yoonia sp. TaxID=2212373 RepID=UPI0025D7DB6E|nr:phage tail protein [Yoonia sp.]
MDLFTPPTAFHFNVVFLGMVPPIPDMAFQEVSGLETELSTEPLQEGGENRFVHNLPKQVKHPNLKLKRAMTTMASGLVYWCKTTLEGGFAEPIKPRDMVVSLLNDWHLPVATWSITNAYPVKWTVGNFDAMKNELAVEMIELSYLSVERKQ